jgi:hypothetical protein
VAKNDALELQMIGQDRREYVRGREGISIEAELESFLFQSHGYEGGWVKVVGDDARYVRYDRIASVSIVRGLDDEAGPAFRAWG